MTYYVKELAKLSGVSSRTLRYYEEVGLLVPDRMGENGYRSYPSQQVDRLQQILFFKELGIELKTIKSLLDDENFDRLAALEGQLETLRQEEIRIGQLRKNVEKTIITMKGEANMSDREKFEGFKKSIIEENEDNFGIELREKYGEDTMDEANESLKSMTQGQWQYSKHLQLEINRLLKDAVEVGNPACIEAQMACDFHMRWLSYFWPEGSYTKEAHRDLGRMYAEDSRFVDYYDKVVKEGAAAFFRDALEIFTK